MKFLNNYSKILLIIPAIMLSGCMMTLEDKNSREKVDDNLIISLINFDYAKDRLLNPFKIKVYSKNGNVRLKGDVKTKTEYVHAVKIAQSKDGVRNVDASELSILDSVQPVTDATITGRVYGHIMRAKLFSSRKVELWPVKIETKEGIVYLSGTLDTKDERNLVLMTAIRVAGDKSVNDKLLKYKK